MSTPSWLLLVISLPDPTKAARTRVWRALRTSGAGALRDGVYVLPNSPAAMRQFTERATDVVADGGTAELVAFDSSDPDQQARLLALFDRDAEYVRLIAQAPEFRTDLGAGTGGDAERRIASLRREIARRNKARYQKRPWATRVHLWVDRVVPALLRALLERE